MPVPGQLLGSYEITALAGKGGMGEVYRARDTKLKRDVAIKLLPEEFSADPDRVVRFQREAELVASLNHPNIATIHDLQEVNGSRFLVLEFVEGETLADRVSRGAMALDESLHIAKQICEALAAAHEKGIIHRDLKPANIKLTADDKVKVLDFGLAKIFQEQPISNLSNSPTLVGGSIAGVIMGTAAYMSPEQARGRDVDRRSDIWSFGAVLFEMLSGKPAFSGETITDILGRIVTVDPDWTLLPDGTPTAIRKLLRRCLQKDRRVRMQDIMDAGLEITEAQAPNDPALSPSRIAIKTRGQYVSLGLNVLLAVLLLSSITLLYRRQTAPQADRVRFDLQPPAGMDFGSLSPERSPVIAVSPDGRKLAYLSYLSGGNTNKTAWVRFLDSEMAEKIEGLDTSPFQPGGTFFWSPDSRFLAFWHDRKLKKYDLISKNVSVICEVDRGQGTWNSQGIILFRTIEGNGLFTVQASGGVPQSILPLDSAQGDVGYTNPWFLPDGRHFIFRIQSRGTERVGIYAGELGSPVIKKLLGVNSDVKYSPPGYILYANPDGVLLVQPFDPGRLEVNGEAHPILSAVGMRGANGPGGNFSISANGLLAYYAGSEFVTELTWFNRTGKVLGAVPEMGDYFTLNLSPSDQYLALQSKGDIITLDLLRGGKSRLTAPGVNELGPVWSPDGKSIRYLSNIGKSGGGLTATIFDRASDGTGDERLIWKSDTTKRAGDFSSDGTFVYADQDPKTSFDLMILSTADIKPTVFLNTRYNEWQPQFAPGGKWIAYVSDESGRDEVYIREFPSANTKIPISTAGGEEPRWSRDGKEIYYIAPDSGLMAVAIKSGLILSASTPHKLFDTEIRRTTVKLNYAVTKDGRFLINTVRQFGSTPISIVLNWPSLLQQ